MADDPSWMKVMKEITGTKEVPGPDDNQEILRWAKFIGERFPDLKGYAAGYNDDGIAWCGLTVAYVMAKSGIKPPKTFLWARDWAKWGSKLSRPMPGCVMVFTRGSGGHVALYEGETETHYLIRGGNQSNAVNLTRYPKANFLAAVWPPQESSIRPEIPQTTPPVSRPVGVDISAEAFDLIVKEEVTSQAAYERRYIHPIWPGASSGITIGIGYDVGAGVSSKDQLQQDWGGKIPQHMIDQLASCIGITGTAAQSKLPMNSVSVPWSAAMDVFRNNTLPKYYGMAERALPNFNKLSSHCKGAIVSLVYNRGAGGFNNPGERYAELRAIKEHMKSESFAKIPDEFRKMKRLWSLQGLINRREAEAKLFEKGLKQPLTSGQRGAIGAVVTIGAGTAATVSTKTEKAINWPVTIGTVVATVAIIILIIFLAKRWSK